MPICSICQGWWEHAQEPENLAQFMKLRSLILLGVAVTTLLVLGSTAEVFPHPLGLVDSLQE
jgi:hypothetical protein